MGQNIHRLNGDNNKKETNNKEMYKYISASRSMLRMMWFMHYLRSMFREIYNNRTNSISDCCTLAYEEAFGEKHSTLVRFSAKAAL